jgi:hypothetical protein
MPTPPGQICLPARGQIYLKLKRILAAGVSFELAPKTRSLWGTTVGKIGLALFAGFCVFVADLYGRVLIYKMTGENPDAFPSARTALIWIFTLSFGFWD